MRRLAEFHDEFIIGTRTYVPKKWRLIECMGVVHKIWCYFNCGNWVWNSGGDPLIQSALLDQEAFRGWRFIEPTWIGKGVQHFFSLSLCFFFSLYLGNSIRVQIFNLVKTQGTHFSKRSIVWSGARDHRVGSKATQMVLHWFIITCVHTLCVYIYHHLLCSNYVPSLSSLRVVLIEPSIPKHSRTN